MFLLLDEHHVDALVYIFGGTAPFMTRKEIIFSIIISISSSDSSIPKQSLFTPANHSQELTMVKVECIFIPDLESHWRWPRSLNPHLADIDQECTDWAASFGAFTPEAQRAVDKCKFSQCLTAILMNIKVALGE